MKRFILPAIMATALAGPGFVGAAAAQQSQSAAMSTQNQAGYTVTVNGQQVMTLAAAADLSAENRADMVRQRLNQVLVTDPRADQRNVQASDVSVATVNNLPVIRVKDKNLITVTHADAKLMNMKPQAAAQQWAGNLRSALSGFSLGAGEPLPKDFIVINPGGQANTANTQAQNQNQSQQKAQAQSTAFAAVRVNNREVMRLAAAGDYTPEHRAEMVRERIRAAYEHQPNQGAIQYQGSDITVETVSGMPVIRIEDANLITVTHADAKLLGKDVQAVAQQWAADLREALKNVELTRQEVLPRGFVSIATGQMTGGGAGTAEEQDKNKQKDQDMKQNKNQNKDMNHQQHNPNK